MTPFANAARPLMAVAALAGAAALVAACGSSTVPRTTGASPAGTATTTPSKSPGGPTPTVPSRSAETAPPGPPPCRTSALRVSVSASQGAAAGSSYYPIVFTNISGAACTLFGYPGVSFVAGAGGSQIGIPATENPAHPRQLITLAPGQAGHAELQVVNAENYPPANCGMVTAHWLRVYPPNQTAPLYASFTAQACAKPRTILTVETVQPGTSGA
jgi:Protein of unknown function (DUF4232)